MPTSDDEQPGTDLENLDPEVHVPEEMPRHRDGARPSQIEINSYRFNGPIPHPSILQQYEEVVPGSAAKIVAAFTDEGEHRRDLERRDDKRLSLGQVLGFIIAMAFLGCSTFLIATGQPIAGTILGTVDLVALVTVFVVGRRPLPDEYEED